MPFIPEMGPVTPVGRRLIAGSIETVRNSAQNMHTLEVQFAGWLVWRIKELFSGG